MIEWLNAHAMAVSAGGFLLVGIGVFLIIKMLGETLRVALCVALIVGGGLILWKFAHRAFPQEVPSPRETIHTTVQNATKGLPQSPF